MDPRLRRLPAVTGLGLLMLCTSGVGLGCAVLRGPVPRPPAGAV